MNEIEKILNNLNITQNYYLIGIIIGLFLCFIMLYFFHRRYRKKEEAQIAEGHLETIMELLDEINNIYHIIENKRHALGIYTGKTQEKTFKASHIIDKISQQTKSAQQILDEGEQLIQEGKNLKKVEENIMSAESIIEEINNILLKDVDSIQDELQQMESSNTEKLNSIQKELENIYLDTKNQDDDGRISNMITDVRIDMENISRKQVEGDVYTSYLMLQKSKNLLIELKNSIHGVKFVLTPQEESETPEPFTILPIDSPEEEKIPQIKFPKEEQIFVVEQPPEQQGKIPSDEEIPETGMFESFSAIFSPLTSEESLPLEKKADEKLTERIQRLKEKEPVPVTEPIIPQMQEYEKTNFLEQAPEIVETPTPALNSPSSPKERSVVGELERLKGEIEKVKGIVDRATSKTQVLTNSKGFRREIAMKANKNSLNTPIIDKDELRILNERKIANLLTELNNVKQEILGLSQTEFPILVKSFVPSNWSDISQHLMKADKLMSDSAKLINAAVELNTPELERFYRADINMQRAEQKLNEAKFYCKEIKQKLQELIEYRKSAKIYWNNIAKDFKILQKQTNTNVGDKQNLSLKNMLTNLLHYIKQAKTAFNPEIQYDYAATKETLDELNKKIKIVLSKFKEST